MPGTVKATPSARAPSEVPRVDDRSYDDLKRCILRLTRIDLEQYKETQMRRRLTNLLGPQAADVAAYCRLLGQDRVELAKLRDFLTINVTEFFRDVASFDALRREVLPVLLRRSPRLKIWSAGCSRGAEPYSIAMLLEVLTPGERHRILGTDIDATVLKHAREGGPFPAAEIRGLERVARMRFMHPDGPNWRVSEAMRSRVEFRSHDLLVDRFDEGFDLICCRNVVIYFKEETKRVLTERFVRALRPGGVLFIGATEALLSPEEFGLRRLGDCFFERMPAAASLARGA